MRNILIKNRILLIFALLIVNVNLTSVQARVIVHEKEKFYSVRGKTGAQVYNSIMRTGKRFSKPRHAMASTLRKIDIGKIKAYTTKKYCKISRIDLIVSLVYTYPKWRGYKKADRNAKKRWDNYFRQLKKHEKKHGAIAVKAARDFERGFKRSRGRLSKKCNDWSDSMVRSLKRLAVKHERQHAAFDKRDGRERSQLRRSFAALKKAK